MAEQYLTSVANPSSTLLAGIGSGDASLQVQSGDTGNFPSTGTFRLRVENEIIIVGSRSGQTLSGLSRGAEGTTAAAHSGGISIYLTQTAASLRALIGLGSQRGTNAGRPGSPDTGTIYADTDGVSEGYWDGSQWRERGPIYPLTAPPTLGSWTWSNQGTATATQVGSAITLQCPAAAGGTTLAPRMLYKAIPQAAPWSVAAHLPNPVVLSLLNQTVACGLALYESATGKMLTFTYYSLSETFTSTTSGTFNNGSSSVTTSIPLTFYRVEQWSSPTTDAGVVSNDYRGPYTPWMKVRDGGAADGNIHFSLSSDGQTWGEIDTRARATYFTTAADKVGWFVINNDGSTPPIQTVAATLAHWLEGTS